MSDFQLSYALRSVLTGSHQDVVDVQLYRASINMGRLLLPVFFCRLLNKCKV